VILKKSRAYLQDGIFLGCVRSVRGGVCHFKGSAIVGVGIEGLRTHLLPLYRCLEFDALRGRGKKFISGGLRFCKGEKKNGWGGLRETLFLNLPVFFRLHLIFTIVMGYAFYFEKIRSLFRQGELFDGDASYPLCHRFIH
jgi:hypothetical protein